MSRIRAKLSPYYSLIALLIVAQVIMIAMDRPLVRGDGTAYLAWIDTLIIDRDLELQNQVDKLYAVNTYQIAWNRNTNGFAIVFPFGIAFLQAPFYAIGHVFASNGWLDLNPEYFEQMQGRGLPYSLWLMIGANLMALGSVSAIWWLGRRWANAWLSAVVALAVFVGTPLLYYSTVDVLNSHNGSSFALAVVIWIVIVQTGAFSKSEKDPQQRTYLWILMGILAGMTILIRWQLFVSVAPIWLLLAYKREWRGFWVSGITTAITLLPLPYIWNAMFGAPFVIPFNEVEQREFLQTGNQFLLVLENLIIHSPITILFFLGLPLIWRKDKAWAALFAGMFGAQLFVNGAALDWYAGNSYGMRRMSELFVIYGVSALFITNWAWERFGQRVRIGIGTGYGVFFAYTALYVMSFFVWTWTNPQGFFIVEPWRMIPYWLNHPYTIPVFNEVIASHVGPLAWSMPGP